MASPVIERIEIAAFTVPTDGPEQDGTIDWRSTSVVVVEAYSSGERGTGYAYGDPSAAEIAAGSLAPRLLGREASSTEALSALTARAVRNMGRAGAASTALSAIDAACWDLKARLLGVPLFRLLGAARERVAAYGSGGFTSYSVDRLCEQLAGWVESGIDMVKMKIGASPEHDLERVAAAREAIGPRAGLFVDANGAYHRKQALAMADRLVRLGVSWFEEPVSSEDLEGLRLLRDRAPAPIAVAAGEYAHDLHAFRALLEAGAVDVLQADATRCGGPTGFLKAAALAEAFDVPLSAHTAPTLHAHLCCAASAAVHVEYFHDHARLEPLLFDGALSPQGAYLAPNDNEPGLGLSLRRRDARRFLVSRHTVDRRAPSQPRRGGHHAHG